jgi:hypothetical protein
MREQITSTYNIILANNKHAQEVQESAQSWITYFVLLL